MKQNERLLSLDALRGFDMLFIMGFSGLIAAICALWPSPLTDAVARQMGHVSWNGLTQHDTIFPLFLFIAGVSFPFSLAKQRVVGVSERRILFKVIRRGVTLVILGMVYNGLLRFDFASLRMASVLGRIGLAWMFAALLYMYCGLRTRIAFAAVVLIGYSLLICLVVAPDAPDGSDPLSVTGNIAGWVDRQWLPGTLACGSFDPEGLLSTLPAIVSALFGMFTGEFLLRKRAVAQRRSDCTLYSAGRRGHHVDRNRLELLDAHQQKIMEQFIHLCGNGLFIGIVRIVLLPDRRAGLETMALFLPCSRVELHHDLYGAADRRIRRHCEFLFRRSGLPLSRGDSTGNQQRRLCRRMLAVSLFPLPKKHILESLTHSKDQFEHLPSFRRNQKVKLLNH